jgi:hypothetical protein
MVNLEVIERNETWKKKFELTEIVTGCCPAPVPVPVAIALN